MIARSVVRLVGTVLSGAAVLVATTCEAPGEPPTPVGPTGTSSPTTHPTPRPRKADEIVVVAVGDIVCDPASSAFDGHDPSQCQHRATGRLVGDADAVLVLGDLQYEHGSLSAYRAGYDRTWGRFADITFPSPGNHEYETPAAEGYFAYWRSKGRPTGAGLGFYSVDLGSWHVISLDSNCVSCGEGSPQDTFLERDLARTRKACILAFWHHPYFNSGSVHGEETPTRLFWDDLHAAGADVVLNGHEHNYQRYAEQSPSGRATSRGIREFVVGTGGRSLYGLIDEKDANYQAGDASHFGVLRLSLRQRSYAWEFVAVGGEVLDRGGPTRCN